MITILLKYVPTTIPTEKPIIASLLLNNPAAAADGQVKVWLLNG